MSTAAVYVRVSTEAQGADNKVSLPRQEEECRKLADRLGLQVRVFSDECSGQTTNRPALQALIGGLSEFSTVICLDATRLGRNRDVLSTLRRLLTDAGVQLRMVIGDTADLDDETAPIVEAVSDGLTEVEIKRFVRRAREGRNGAAVQGYAPTNMPFGYRTVRTELGPKSVVHIIEVDPDAAAVVAQIYGEFLRGASTRGIADGLTASLTPAPRGQVWHKSTIKRILADSTYMGTWTYNKHRTARIDGKKSRKDLGLRDPSEWIYITVPALVDPATHAAVQDRMVQHSKTLRRRPKRAYLLSGLIQCATCGRTYWSDARGEVRTYRHRRSDTCAHHQLGADTLEADVMAVATRLIHQPAVLSAILAAQEAKREQVQGQRDAAIARAERRLRSAQKAIDNLLDAVERGTIEAEARLPERRAQLATAKAALAEAQAEPVPVTPQEWASWLREAVPADPEGWTWDAWRAWLLATGAAVVLARDRAPRLIFGYGGRIVHGEGVKASTKIRSGPYTARIEVELSELSRAEPR